MFDKLKSLFIEDDGKPVKEKAAKAAPATAKPKNKEKENVAIPKTSTKSTKSAAAPTGKPSPKFVNVLLKAIEANNLEGFDYLEFKQALQNLGSVEMDTRTKYQSALAMAKAMGANSKNLLSSAKHYLKVLAKEEHKFQVALKGQRANQVQGKQNEIKKHELSITDKEKQIAKLQAEIEAHTKALAQTKNGIQKATDKVEATNDSFMLALQVVRSKIEEDISNMNQYF